MKFYSFEEQVKKPSRNVLELFPNYSDNLNRLHSWKLRALEPHSFTDPTTYQLRSTIAQIPCDQQTFAYFMCMRNMSRHASTQLCKVELADMRECRHGLKRVARHQKLMAASKKAGDIIPNLHGNLNWTY